MGDLLNNRSLGLAFVVLLVAAWFLRSVTPDASIDEAPEESSQWSRALNEPMGLHTLQARTAKTQHQPRANTEDAKKMEALLMRAKEAWMQRTGTVEKAKAKPKSKCPPPAGGWAAPNASGSADTPEDSDSDSSEDLNPDNRESEAQEAGLASEECPSTVVCAEGDTSCQDGYGCEEGDTACHNRYGCDEEDSECMRRFGCDKKDGACLMQACLTLENSCQDAPTAPKAANKAANSSQAQARANSSQPQNGEKGSPQSNSCQQRVAACKKSAQAVIAQAKASPTASPKSSPDADADKNVGKGKKDGKDAGSKGAKKGGPQTGGLGGGGQSGGTNGKNGLSGEAWVEYVLSQPSLTRINQLIGAFHTQRVEESVYYYISG